MKKISAPAIATLDKYSGMDFQPLYSTSVKVTGSEAAHGRASCTVHSDDGNLELELHVPSALGGPGGATNPEQLFAAGFAATFHGALILLAQKAGIQTDDAAVDVSVTFGRDPVDGLYALLANVNIELPRVPTAIAEELIRNTERLCPYTKMARQGIVCVATLVR
jgi:Ohr subfamily peroxiredoxin